MSAEATQEPKSVLTSAGLGHLDFEKRSAVWSTRRAFQILPAKRRIALAVLALIQVGLGLMDLVGVFLIGLVVALAVSGFGASSLPTTVVDRLTQFAPASITLSQLSVILALVAVFLLVLKTFLSALLIRRTVFLLASCMAELASSLAGRFLKLRLTQIQKWTTSEAVYALGSGVAAATTNLLGSSVTVIAEVALFLILGISLLLFDPLVTTVSLIVFGLVGFGLQRYLGRKSAQNAALVKDSTIQTFSIVQEALLTFREISVLQRTHAYIQRYGTVVSKFSRAGANNAFLMEVPKFVLEATLYIGIVVLAISQFLTQNWGAAAATVAVYMAAGTRVIPALLRVQGAVITIRNSSAMAQPTFFMVDFIDQCEGVSRENLALQSPQSVEKYDNSNRDRFDPHIRIENMSFTYDPQGSEGVHDITVDVPPRTSLAIVGETGAGKSTLADLILGLLSPTEGRVEISGCSPSTAASRWPGAISYVPQNVVLVPGSVRQNVALGLRPEEIDDERVFRALQQAHILDYLVGEREGLETQVGERGYTLSGGQKQRLGLARALYSQPQVLVLDEATSALDASTENAIVETMRQLDGDVTTVVIAHRIATIRSAHQILFLQSGRSIAVGTFDEVRQASSDFDRQARLSGL